MLRNENGKNVVYGGDRVIVLFNRVVREGHIEVVINELIADVHEGAGHSD